MEHAFEYVKKNKGLQAEATYPNEAKVSLVMTGEQIKSIKRGNCARP